MNRDELAKLEDHFRAFIMPLLREDDPEDYRFIWEFQKLAHAKKLRVLTAEHEFAKRLKQALLNR